MTTIRSRLDADARVTVDFGDEPVVVEQSGRKVFLHRVSFRQGYRSAVYGSGRGFFARKDGTEGQAVANVYSVRISDLPPEVAEQVAAGLRLQLDRVGPVLAERTEVTL